MLAPQPQRFRDVLVANSFDPNTILGIQYKLGLAGVNVSAYLKSTFYLPSYPTSQVCLDYLNSCGTFINASKVPALVPHCQTVVKGVIQFPSANQTIATVDLSPGLSIKYTTAPNKMSTASDQGYKPICPDGYETVSGPIPNCYATFCFINFGCFIIYSSSILLSNLLFLLLIHPF